MCRPANRAARGDGVGEATLDDLSRLAINQATMRRRWTLRQAVEGLGRHGVRSIAVWRDKVDACGLEDARRILDDHGMRVTGLNRIGPFSGPDAPDFARALDDARRGIDEAAALRADCLLFFPGGMAAGSKDIAAARAIMAEALERLVEDARAAGVVLALEPLHPVYAAERSPLNLMSQANDLRERLGHSVGVVIDVYHVWWDPNLEREIRRCGRDGIAGFHVNDWLVPTRNPLLDRGMMGDGVIDIRRIRGWVDATGYDGPIEVELFSESWWDKEPDAVVATCIERFRTVV